jgi:hypothetical protein
MTQSGSEALQVPAALAASPDPWAAESAPEIYLDLADSNIPPVAEYLRRRFSARLAAVFAEDRCAVEGRFYNYYVFEHPAEDR